MNDQENRLDQLLDCWEAATLDRDLTAAVLDRARVQDAALDRVLDQVKVPSLETDLTARVLDRVRREDAALDRVMAVADSVPVLDRDLSDDVMSRVHQRQSRRRVLGFVGSLAAAAAVVLGVWLVRMHHEPTPTQPVAKEVKTISPEDRVVVNNLDLLEDYQVLSNWETIRAMEQMEQGANR